ncbi:hypothetical protein EJB05_34867, partial [Eragrostis curvula]
MREPPKRANPPAGAAAAAQFCESQRHRYFPAHRAALAASLTRFRSKLPDLRRAVLRGASSSQPPRPHIWRPSAPPTSSTLTAAPLGTGYLLLDPVHLGANSIFHLASNEHLKGVKEFLRKNRGGMDLWEKGCESSSTGAKKGTEGLIGPPLGPMKDTRNETTSDNLDSLHKTISSLLRVIELPLPESLLILLHMELLGCPSHLGDRPIHRSSRIIEILFSRKRRRDHRNTSVGNGPNPLISCPVH